MSTEGAAGPTADAGLKANKELVTGFIDAFYNDKDWDRARELLAEDFVNHHHGVGVGRDRTVETFREQAGIPFPQFSLTIVRIIAEGDQVWTHNVVRVAPGAPPVITADLWRIADGRLAEHWDVAQAVPAGADLDELIADAP
ncbi:nuclear transport factor 2 family protein [Kitasatospora sp. NPDC059146]